MDRRLIHTTYHGDRIKMTIQIDIKLNTSTNEYDVYIPEQKFMIDEIFANDEPIISGHYPLCGKKLGE